MSRWVGIGSLMVASLACKEPTPSTGASGASAASSSSSSSASPTRASEPIQPAGKPYALTVTPLAPSSTESAARITLEPRGGYKVNLEYPLKLTVAPSVSPGTASSAAKPPALELNRKDAEMWSAARVVLKPTFKLSAPVSSASPSQFSGELRFSVCTDKQCEIYTEKLAWVGGPTR